MKHFFKTMGCCLLGLIPVFLILWGVYELSWYISVDIKED